MREWLNSFLLALLSLAGALGCFWVFARGSTGPLVERPYPTVESRQQFSLQPSPGEPLSGTASAFSPYPAPGAELVLPGTTSELLISWSRPVQGYLMLRKTGTPSEAREKARLIPLPNLTFAKVPTPPSGRYEWQLIDEGQNPIAGPFSLSIRRADLTRLPIQK